MVVCKLVCNALARIRWPRRISYRRLCNIRYCHRPVRTSSWGRSQCRILILTIDIPLFATLFLQGSGVYQWGVDSGRLYSNITSYGHEHEITTRVKDVIRLLWVGCEEGVMGHGAVCHPDTFVRDMSSSDIECIKGAGRLHQPRKHSHEYVVSAPFREPFGEQLLPCNAGLTYCNWVIVQSKHMDCRPASLSSRLCFVWVTVMIDVLRVQIQSL